MTTVSSQLTTLNSTYLASANCALLGNVSGNADPGYIYGIGSDGTGATKSVLANKYQSVTDNTQATTSFTFGRSDTTIYVFNTNQDNSGANFQPYLIGNASGLIAGTSVSSTDNSIQTSDFEYHGPINPQPSVDSVNFTDNTRKITTDINCMEFFFTSRSGINSIPDGFFCLQALYAWYSLLDNDTWKTYSRPVPSGTTATPVNIYVPDILTGNSSSNITHTRVTLRNNGTGFPASTAGIDGSGQLKSLSLISSDSVNTLSAIDTLDALMDYYIPFNNLVDNNGPKANFNPFVARRIIHLHIMSFHWNLAQKYYTNQTYATVIPPLITALNSLLVAANDNVLNSDGILSKINTGIQTRSKTYYDDQNTLNDLNSSSSAKPNSVPNLQTTVNQYNTKLSVTLQYESTIKKYKTAGIAVLAVIIGSIGVLYVSPIDGSKKMIYCGLLIILAVATAFSLQYLLNKTLTTEGFDATGATSLNNSYKDEAIKYLQNTTTLAATLDNYHLYGDASYALNNQVSYYTDAQTSLSMKSQNLKDVNSISYINQITASATINFCVAVSLILSISATLYFSSQNYPGLRSAIVYISALLIFIAIVIYVLEINNRVHTHPKQIYWGADTRAFSNSA